MKNKNGFISMTLVYTFLILFLFLMTGILTSYNQRNKYYDIIEEKIKSEMNLTSFRNNTLYNTILKDNKAYPDNTDASPSVDSKDGIDFSKPSSLTNGIGLFYTGDTSYTNDNKTVYYFRGSDVNNYILTNFGMYRILRTTEDGNIKIIKDSSYSTAYSTSYNDVTGNKSVGFMYGTDEDESTLTSNELYLKTHTNTNDSKIKKELNDDTNISTYLKDLLVDTAYCNNRIVDTTATKISDVTGNTAHDSFTIDSTKTGYGTHNTVYYNVNRIKKERPRFNCTRQDDSGNYIDYITSKAGLITLDEAIYSGISLNSNDTESHSFVKKALTMTPNYYYYDSSTNEEYAGIFYIKRNNQHEEITTVSTKENVDTQKVFTIKGDIIISKGNGTLVNPYVINGGA